MTTLDPPILQEATSPAWQRPMREIPQCFLYWRCSQLLVLPRSERSDRIHPDLPPLADPTWLSDCLKRSPIRLVRIDAALAEPTLKRWAEACEHSGKALYLRLPPTPQLPSQRTKLLWGWKRLFDWAAAGLLVLLLSPLLLAISAAVLLTSPGAALYSQWRVGRRGKLFRVLKFRTMTSDAEQQHDRVMANQAAGCLHKREDDPRITPLGKWLRRYSLDELPQLINVLRGEMSLVGPRPWALYDAVRIHPEMQARLNALPGITGAWQVEARSMQLDLDAVSHRDLEYLKNWSLQGDFKILLRTVPKVLSGFGAF